MPKQIEVLVEDISKDDNGQPTELTGTTRTLTYKSFLYLNSNPENPRYKLLYQVDEDGNEVPGSPNLEAQHRTSLHQRSVAPVVNSGPAKSAREIELEQKIKELESKQTVTTPPVVNTVVDPPLVNKGGRGKKKLVTENV